MPGRISRPSSARAFISEARRSRRAGVMALGRTSTRQRSQSRVEYHKRSTLQVPSPLRSPFKSALEYPCGDGPGGNFRPTGPAPVPGFSFAVAARRTAAACPARQAAGDQTDYGDTALWMLGAPRSPQHRTLPAQHPRRAHRRPVRLRLRFAVALPTRRRPPLRPKCRRAGACVQQFWCLCVCCVWSRPLGRACRQPWRAPRCSALHSARRRAS